MSHRPPNPPRQSTYAPSTRTARTNRTNISAQTHNLAGPPARPPLPRTDAHNTYYAAGYRSLNPLMESSEPRPSFSLARTFPHNVRWGAGKTPKTDKRDPKAVREVEKVGTETAPWSHQADVEGANAEHGEEEVEWEGGSDVVESGGSTQYEAEDDEKQVDESPVVQHRQVDAFRENGECIGNVAEEDVVEPDSMDRPFNQWAMIRLRFQRPLAEWLGTTIYSFIGISGTLAVQTSTPSSTPLQSQSQYWTWGFATMLAIYISGGGSGAFLNPALTILLSVFRGFPAKRVPIYILSQLLGTFTGALLAFAVYRDGILMMDDGMLSAGSTGTAFYTQPQEWMGNGSAFLTEMLGTAVIGISILALGDSGNSPPGAGMHAFVIGLLITTVTMALGQGTGGCFNPARDLGPRIATVVVGYDSGLWSERDWWWIWGPWGATIIGALLGGFVYDVCVFKGGESPVNYSWRRWKVEGLKEERAWAEKLGWRRKTEDLQKRLEEGEIEKE